MNKLIRFWRFLKEDTWQSWIVSLILMVILIKVVFFPTLSFITGSPLPLVVIESCSMYHGTNFDKWWTKSEGYYEIKEIEKEDFEEFSFRNGMNKGDIIVVWGRDEPELGDVIIFQPDTKSSGQHPIIHRVITIEPLGTKGDHNERQLQSGNNVEGIDETDIAPGNVLGKSVIKIPLVGWVKLLFFEFSRPPEQRGLCRP